LLRDNLFRAGIPGPESPRTGLRNAARWSLRLVHQ
jgi:hypothetical protein